MLFWLFAAHVAGIVGAVIGGRRSIQTALLIAAVAPALTAFWAAGQLISGNTDTVASFTWVEGLDIGIHFAANPVGLMMMLLVSGIGAGVFIYAMGYFSPGAPGGTRFPSTLLAFSTSMLGLVLADSIWTLFIFWEFTTVTSFLLVGHKHQYEDVRAAARRALTITGGGGLALLAGLLVLARETGTSTISEFTPVTGTAATTAAIFVLIGAATKSAQFPFHVWLPGAMAAPTPVSAYLHSATMVKAGVLAVAVLSPVFADVAWWKTLGLAFGIASLFWGAVGALRQRDGKLILAWGTVSQLGLLITLLSLGSAKATFAGISMLFAHALFKAALFLTIGEIDIRTGTRNIDELGGLSKSMPINFAVALAAGVSMMGAPPLLGFMTKEAAIEAGLGLSGGERVIVLGAIVAGSVLTVAYTVRYLVCVYGSGPDIEVGARRIAMTVPAVVLAALSVLGYFGAPVVNKIVGPAAVQINPDAIVYELIRWPGLKTAFVISIGIVIGGTVLGVLLSRQSLKTPNPVGAETADRMIDSVLEIAPKLTAAVQHGSLPVYLATMSVAMIVASSPFYAEVDFVNVVLWDHPVQGALAVAIVVSAVAGVFVNSRLGAALTLGAVGTGVSGLFIVQGAPDLALTQLLVETVIVVGFVLGLGHLRHRFPDSTGAWKLVRFVLGVAGGVAVVSALVASSSAPAGTAPIEEFAVQSVDEGGGNNIVNVILTDMRALDTLGEVVVLATVAMGILALARLRGEEAGA